MAELYMVGTPIGNLEDMTYRAVRILGEVDVIACEDTRHTQKLLNAYEIKKRTISCRSQNEEQSAEGIVALLEQGKSVAFVSDAGTPGVSDPGNRLAARVREAGFTVRPIPGVSAATALLSVGGVPGKGFVFEGFLSPKSGKRRKALEELMEGKKSFIIYESPHRIVKLIRQIAEISSERLVIIGREMTKNFEEFLSGPAGEVAERMDSGKTWKGEFAVLVSPGKKS